MSKTALYESQDLAKRPRLPSWFRRALPKSPSFLQTRNLVSDLSLHTVCESAKCPNHWECWSHGTATFMIAGDRCTRACGFCAVDTAKPLALDPMEPHRVAEAAARLKLRHVVITAVARDDLEDGGALHFRHCIEAVRKRLPESTIEVLTPDFLGKEACLSEVMAARPEVFNHNLETVRRLTPKVRFRSEYDRSLAVLDWVHQRFNGQVLTKSGMMLGLGEKDEEVVSALEDLRRVGCDILTLGQYLQPTLEHLPVVEFVTPERFVELKDRAQSMGFKHVESGPLVRSSYHAGEFRLGKKISGQI